MYNSIINGKHLPLMRYNLKKYDVIIAGSGVGGLSAAAALVQRGQKVLLLEKHNVPGGYATSFMRKEFEFDASLHWLSGIGTRENPGPLYCLLEEYGVIDKLDFIPVHTFYRYKDPETDITLPWGVEESLNYLCSEYPQEEKGLKKLFQVIQDVAEEMNRVQRGIKGDFPVIEEFRNKSLTEVLTSFLSSRGLISALSQIGNYFATPFHMISFIDYAPVYSLFLTYGAVQIKGKSQALSQAFAEVIKEKGGDVLLNTRVKRILTEENRVTGVLTEKGDKILADYIISNISPYETCYNLIGEDKVPKWYLDLLNDMTPGGSLFNVYLGLDIPSKELGLTTHTMFLRDRVTTDHNMTYEEFMDFEENEVPAIGITNFSFTDPDCAPENKTILSLTHLSYGKNWINLSPKEYSKCKEKVTERYIELAETVIPDLRKHIEVIDASTPLTNIRYTENTHGSFVGFKETRIVNNKKKITAKGPLKGLYFASQWVNGGSFPRSMFSGKAAAMAIINEQDSSPSQFTVNEKRDYKPAEYVITKKIIEENHPEKILCTVKNIEGSQPAAIILKPDVLPSFKPGQYINLFIEKEDYKTSRPYTICPSPKAECIRLCINPNSPDGVSSYIINALKEGDRVEISQPMGDFFYNKYTDQKKAFFLCQGTGIVPVKAIIENILSKNLTISIAAAVVHGGVFSERLDPLKDKIGLTTLSREEAADKDKLKELINSFSDCTFYLAGDEKYIKIWRKSLKSFGVQNRYIRSEVHRSLSPESEESEFNVYEQATGISFKVNSSEPLMSAIEKAGLRAPVVCRTGTCSSCRTELISGDITCPYAKKRSIDSDGIIHPCVSYAVSDLVINLG